MIANLNDVLARTHVVSLPLSTKFRGITAREVALIEGPQGWTEFSPFLEYDDDEAANWLRAAYEFGWEPLGDPVRTRIGVNATVPAVEVAEVERVLSAFGTCRTAKVKVTVTKKGKKKPSKRLSIKGKKGVNVFMEKPVASDVAGAKRVLAAAAEAKAKPAGSSETPPPALQRSAGCCWRRQPYDQRR